MTEYKWEHITHLRLSTLVFTLALWNEQGLGYEVLKKMDFTRIEQLTFRECNFTFNDVKNVCKC